MFPLKRISPSGVAAALQKAERYRLLNEPSAAESICLDVIAVDSDNQQAIETLLLAITDQFDREPGELARRAREVLGRLTDPYQRAYYAGIIAERHGLRAGVVADGANAAAQDEAEDAEADAAAQTHDAA